MRGGELSDEMAVALGLDYTKGTRADSPVMGVMGTTLQEEEAVLETHALMVSRGSILKPARSGEGPYLVSPTPSHGRDFDFFSREGWRGTM